MFKWYRSINPRHLPAMVLHSRGLYTDGDLSFQNGYLWITLLVNCSVAVAFTSLVYFYVATRDLLVEHSPTSYVPACGPNPCHRSSGSSSSSSPLCSCRSGKAWRLSCWSRGTSSSQSPPGRRMRYGMCNVCRRGTVLSSFFLALPTHRGWVGFPQRNDANIGGSLLEGLTPAEVVCITFFIYHIDGGKPQCLFDFILRTRNAGGFVGVLRGRSTNIE